MAIQRTRQKRIINQRHMLIAEILEYSPLATQAEIAARLDEEYGISVTQRTISNDLKALKQVHWQRAHKAMEAIKQRLIDEYQTIYAEAMAAWYRSLEDKQVTVTENIAKPETSQQVTDAIERLKVMERTEGQTGNPALLAQARGALQDIEDLLGLEKPKRQDNVNFDLSKATDEQLQRIADGEHPATVMADSGGGSG